jgi:hypothetical protein
VNRTAEKDRFSEYHANLFPNNRRILPRVQRTAFKKDFTGESEIWCQVIQSIEAPDERAFTRVGRSHERSHLPLLNLKR